MRQLLNLAESRSQHSVTRRLIRSVFYILLFATIASVSHSDLLAQGKGKGGGGGGGNGGGGGDSSASDPTDFVIVERTTSEIHVRWNSTGGGTAGFILAYEKDGSPRKKCQSGVQIDVGTTQEWTLTGLDYDSFYGLRVCAYSADGSRTNGIVNAEITLPMVSLEVADDLTVGREIAGRVALQPDGKIVTSGNLGSAPGVCRYLPDGTLDTTFSGNGGAQCGSYTAFAAGLQVLGDGKIFVAVGRVEQEFGMGAIAYLFNPDGSLAAETQFLPGLFDHTGVYDAVELPNGQFLILADVTIDGHNSIRLVRLNSDMTMDTTFGVDGIVSHVYPSSVEFYRFALQDNGYVVAAGIAYEETNAEGIGFVARYDVLDGSEDFATQLVDIDHAFIGVCFDSNGNIYLGGRPDPIGNEYQTEVVRLDSDGFYDSTWANDGVFQLNTSEFSDEGAQVAVDSMDRLYVAGGRNNGQNNDVQVLRLLPNGTLDTDWADNGIFVSQSHQDVWDDPWDIIVDSQDRPIIGGAIQFHQAQLILRLNR